MSTQKFILNHPLTRNSRFSAIRRFIAWQVVSRIVAEPIAMNFVNGSRLLVRSGMTGATGNIYVGLHEFEDMAFVLHTLRTDDLFVDVGANIGSYTVLAGAVAGANCISIEPSPVTFSHLMDNVNLNGFYDRAKCLNVAVGREEGKLQFSIGLDTINHVLPNGSNDAAVVVPVKSLDSILDNMIPTIIKIDVEGFETMVISGAERILAQQYPLAIIMELNGSGVQYGFEDSALHSIMMTLGFQPFKYEPMRRELLPLAGKNTTNGNTLYLKGRHFFTERVKMAPSFDIRGIKI